MARKNPKSKGRRTGKKGNVAQRHITRRIGSHQRAEQKRKERKKERRREP